MRSCSQTKKQFELHLKILKSLRWTWKEYDCFLLVLPESGKKRFLSSTLLLLLTNIALHKLHSDHTKMHWERFTHFCTFINMRDNRKRLKSPIGCWPRIDSPGHFAFTLLPPSHLLPLKLTFSLLDWHFCSLLIAQPCTLHRLSSPHKYK